MRVVRGAAFFWTQQKMNFAFRYGNVSGKPSKRRKHAHLSHFLRGLKQKCKNLRKMKSKSVNKNTL